MARQSTNTRGFIRFKSGIGTNVIVAPDGAIAVTARLLDVNQAGGMGLFIPLEPPFDNLTLATLLATWNILREMKGRRISMAASFFNAIPMVLYKERGIRISAQLHRDEPKGKDGSPAAIRRSSPRNSLPGFPIALTRRDARLDGEIFNIASDDGIGMSFGKEAMENAKWKEIFTTGWRISTGTQTFLCEVRRLGCFDNRVIIGGIASGVGRIVASSSSAKPESHDSEEAGPEKKDDELMEFLEDFLDGKFDESLGKKTPEEKK